MPLYTFTPKEFSRVGVSKLGQDIEETCFMNDFADESEFLEKVKPLGANLQRGDAIRWEKSYRDYGTVFWTGDEFVMPHFDEDMAYPPIEFLCPTQFPFDHFSFLYSECVWLDWVALRDQILQNKECVENDKTWSISEIQHGGKVTRILLPTNYSPSYGPLRASISSSWPEDLDLDPNSVVTICFA